MVGTPQVLADAFGGLTAKVGRGTRKFWVYPLKLVGAANSGAPASFGWCPR